MLAKKEKPTRLQLSSNNSLVSRKEFIFSWFRFEIKERNNYHVQFMQESTILSKCTDNQLLLKVINRNAPILKPIKIKGAMFFLEFYLSRIKEKQLFISDSCLFYVSLQLDWGSSFQDILEKKEALCLSRSRERRKFKTIQREKA